MVKKVIEGEIHELHGQASRVFLAGHGVGGQLAAHLAFTLPHRLGGVFLGDAEFPVEILQAIQSQQDEAYPLMLGKKKDLFIGCGKLIQREQRTKDNVADQMQCLRGLGFHKISISSAKDSLDQAFAYSYTYTYTADQKELDAI